LKQGVVLFAHGSRDPEWARPFQRIEQLVAEHGVPVRLAYLELMKPSLGEALTDLSREVEAIRVVPVFLGYGGHIRKDLPALVAAAKVEAKVTIEPPVGEHPAVIEAIAELIGRGR